MPCYQLILLARPDTSADKLAALFRSIARVVYREHGQFRTISHLGVRPLAYPVRKAGQKFEEARWVQAYYDVAPPSLAAVASAIQSEKGVLQYKHLRMHAPSMELAAFRPSGRKEKLKPFSTAMKFNEDILDVETLRTRRASAQELQ